MGCGSSSVPVEKPIKRPRSNSIHDEGIDIQDLSVAWTEDGYPKPVPPVGRKSEIYNPESFKEVEANAINTPELFLDSYEGLVAHLIEPAHNDLAKVRAIFVWMGLQNINNQKIGNIQNPNSPKAYLKLIQQRKGSYSAMFAVMCRQAKLPCVIIRGIGKSASYEVGDTDLEDLKNNWNAVYVNGSWRFIHPLWALVSLVGHRSGNWTLVETGGVQTQDKQEASAGQLTFQINDFWFLTDPDKMFISCFPDASEWQLLDNPHSLEDFKIVPFLRKAFYHLAFKLKSPKSCRLDTVDGEAEIILEMSKAREGRLKLTYDLFFRDSDSKESTVNNVQLERFVFMNYKKQQVVFSIRFPAAGIYKITLYGSDVQEKAKELDWLCDFRLDCASAKGECEPLPDCPDIGWGPGVEIQQAGMEATTHQEGLIKLAKPKPLDIQFLLHRPTELKTEMLHNKIQKKELLKFVNVSLTDKKASVKVDPLPEPGEYALKLHFRQAVSGKEFYNVVNYLISNPEIQPPPPVKVKEPRRENPYLKNIRQALQEAIERHDIEEIEKAMAIFIREKLKDEGELEKAKDRLEYLHLRKALKEAIMRRHIDVLDVAIQNARNSKHVDKLDPHPLKEAESLRAHVSSMDKSSHPILKLNQRTISEIASYKHPPSLIQGVMTCTFLLLGESKEKLQNWTYIQALLRKTGQYSVKRRILKFDTLNLMEDTVELAQLQIHDFDMDQARECSAGAGTFFKWSKSVIEAGHFDKKTFGQTPVPVSEEKEDTPTSPNMGNETHLESSP